MTIIVYTDGAAVPNPGKGGWAAVFVVNGTIKKEISGFVPHATNNEMEIMAVIEAVSAFTRPSEFVVRSDSQYVIQSMSEWIPRRGHNGYANAILFDQLLKVCEQHTITWEWVRGHSGDKFNDRADCLAMERAGI